MEGRLTSKIEEYRQVLEAALSQDSAQITQAIESILLEMEKELVHSKGGDDEENPGHGFGQNLDENKEEAPPVVLVDEDRPAAVPAEPTQGNIYRITNDDKHGFGGYEVEVVGYTVKLIKDSNGNALDEDMTLVVNKDMDSLVLIP